MNQTLLTSYSPLALEGREIITSTALGHLPPTQGLTVEEAQQFATYVIYQLPKGYRFTLMGLFGKVKMRGSNRSRASMIHSLRRKGMIASAGLTQQDQEKRHKGFATLWEVI